MIVFPATKLMMHVSILQDWVRQMSTGQRLNGVTSLNENAAPCISPRQAEKSRAISPRPDDAYEALRSPHTSKILSLTVSRSSAGFHGAIPSNPLERLPRDLLQQEIMLKCPDELPMFAGLSHAMRWNAAQAAAAHLHADIDRLAGYALANDDTVTDWHRHEDTETRRKAQQTLHQMLPSDAPQRSWNQWVKSQLPSLGACKAVQKMTSARVRNLTVLELHRLQFSCLPSIRDALPSLRTLSLADNQMVEMPAENLPEKLYSLFVRNNPLGKLSGQLFHLPNLTALLVAGCQLSMVESFSALSTSKLEALDLSRNLLTNLPEEMSCLTNLTALNLFGNRFERVPFQALPRDGRDWQSLFKLKLVIIGGGNYTPLFVREDDGELALYRARGVTFADKDFGGGPALPWNFGWLLWQAVVARQPLRIV